MLQQGKASAPIRNRRGRRAPRDSSIQNHGVDCPVAGESPLSGAVACCGQTAVIVIGIILGIVLGIVLHIALGGVGDRGGRAMAALDLRC
jgi:hypothetical protein